MNGEQALVGAAGLGLVAANAWNDRRQWAGLFGQGATTDSHTAAKKLGVEVIGVGVLVVVAGTGDTASKTALAVLGSLWVLWLISYHAHPGPGMAKTWNPATLPGDGPLLPAPSGHGPTITTLPRNTLPGLP